MWGTYIAYTHMCIYIYTWSVWVQSEVEAPVMPSRQGWAVRRLLCPTQAPKRSVLYPDSPKTTEHSLITLTPFQPVWGTCQLHGVFETEFITKPGSPAASRWRLPRQDPMRSDLIAGGREE